MRCFVYSSSERHLLEVFAVLEHNSYTCISCVYVDMCCRVNLLSTSCLQVLFDFDRD